MPDRPNIVIVVLDSVRRDHLSAYGYPRNTTPNIDRLAEASVVFRNAYAASSWTIPSHASLFTGLYPSAHRADFDTRYLDARHATLASVASGRGYRTACFTANGFISHHTNLDHGFGESVDVRRLGPFKKGLLGRASRSAYRRWHNMAGRDRGSARLTRLAKAWLADSSPGAPFLLFLNYMDCHLPYNLRTADRYRFVDPRNRKRADAVPQDPFAIMARGEKLSEGQLRDLKSLYDGALFHLDLQVGALVQELDRLHLADNTVLIVTADHGESFGEHGLLDHQYGLYEHLIAVPLVVRLPGEDRAGEEISEIVQHTDLMPTVAGWVGASSPDALKGTTPLFGSERREWAISEYLVPNLPTLLRRAPDADVSGFDRAFRAIRDERYKLVVSRGGDANLYDLQEDPLESTDVSGAHPARADALRQQLETLLGAWPQVGDSPRSKDVDPELRARLEALGYL